MKLPIQVTANKDLMLLQTTWSSQLNPVLGQPLVQGNLLVGVNLVIGTTAVNHGLGRKLQGWFIVRKRAGANIYDTQDTNINSALTLSLVSDAVVTVDLYVF